MIRPKRPAPAMAARVSGATLLVADADADAELPELLPVALALLCDPEFEPEWLAEEADEPDAIVSKCSVLRLSGCLPVPVVEAEAEAALAEAEAAEAALLVAVKKLELMQLAWHEAYAAVSSSVPLP